jgi:hypothetical protein
LAGTGGRRTIQFVPGVDDPVFLSVIVLVALGALAAVVWSRRG